MSNPMKYIKDLEAAGFQRNQAEAQVQVVLDVLEGDLVTKSDFATFNEQQNGKFAEVYRHFTEIDRRFDWIDHKFKEVDHRFKELELRLTIRLGLITVTTTTIAVAVLSWLIKLN